MVRLNHLVQDSRSLISPQLFSLRGTMSRNSPKKAQRVKLQTLHVHGVPPDILGRINARAALIGHDRDEWIIKLLDEKTEKLKVVQEQLKQDEAE